MGNARTSNKDVLDALNEGFDKLITVLTQQAMPVAAPAETASANQDVSVDEAYKAHQSTKAAAHAVDKGQPVVLYARKNKAGETKIAYALAERFTDVVAKQPSCLGALEIYQP